MRTARLWGALAALLLASVAFAEAPIPTASEAAPAIEGAPALPTETVEGREERTPDERESDGDPSENMLPRQIDLDGAEALLFEAGEPVDAARLMSDLLSGDSRLSDALSGGWLRDALLTMRDDVLRAMRAFVPVALGFMLVSVFPGRDARMRRSLELTCKASCMAQLLRSAIDAKGLARLALSRCVRACAALTPPLSVALGLAGEGSGVLLEPASAIAVELVERLLRDLCLPLCGVAAALEAAIGMTDIFRSRHLVSLLWRLVALAVGGSLAGFMAYLSVQSALSEAAEGTLGRLTRQAAVRLMPMMGRQVAGATGLISGSAARIAEATGVTGLVILACLCLPTLLRLIGVALSQKVVATVIEPIAGKALADTIWSFSAVIEALAAITFGGFALMAMLLGAAMGTARILL